MRKMVAFFITMSLLLVPSVRVCAEGTPPTSYMDSYYNGLPFRAWPIDKQYEFSKELPQLIKSAGEEAYITPSIEEILSHRYGLPTNADITQDQAQNAAMEYLVDNVNETVDKLKGFTWTYSFYVDNEERPEWLITIYDGIYIASNRLYRLTVPARGGMITLLYNHNTAEPTPEEILEQFSLSLPQDREDWGYLDKAAYGYKVAELMELYPEFKKDQAFIIYGLPSEEVPYEDALAFAAETLRNEYGGENGWNETAYTLQSAEFVRVSHSKDPLTPPYWSFVFGADTFYQVYVSAESEQPTLLIVYTPSDKNG